MKTLVTGGTGFLGRHLVRQLLDRGEDVRVLTRSYDRELAEAGAEIVEGSLTDADDVRRAAEEVDRVYHLAGKVTRDKERAHEMYDLHVEGTRRLLGTFVDRQVDKIVVASTSGTVGVSEDPNEVATEESPTRESIVRDWPYYLSKIYAERVCQKFIREHDMPIVMMRPTLLLGPGDRRQSSTQDVVLFLKGKIPGIMSGGISFVDVRDAADGFIRAMEAGEVGDSYLLGQLNLSLKEFFDRLESLSGVSAPKMPIPNSVMSAGARLLDSASRRFGLPNEIDPVSVEMAGYYWYIDSSKARRQLDWQPRDPNDTLRDTIRWIRNNHPDFVDTKSRPTPPPEYVPEETVAFAKEMSGSEE